MTPAMLRIRAILGAVFALLGIVIAAELIARDAPFNQKIFGLAFAAVMIALGVVRFRSFRAALRRTRP